MLKQAFWLLIALDNCTLLRRIDAGLILFGVACYRRHFLCSFGIGRQTIFSIFLVCFRECERREQTLRQTKAVEIAWLFHKAFFHEKSSSVSLIQNSFRSISPFGSAKSCCHPFAYGQILKIAVFPVTHFESRGTVDKNRIKCLFFVYRLVQIRLARPRK